METLKLKNNKILIVAAHPDDEIIGCGGTIIKFKEKTQINVLFMSDGVSSRSNKKKITKKNINIRRRECLDLFKKLKLTKPVFLNFPDNQMDKIPLLKIVKKIEKYINKFKPNTIFTHFENCLNIDHRVTFNAVITACRPINNSSVKEILSFEIPSSTDWSLFNRKHFQPNYYIDISKEIKKKLESLKYYKSELKKYPHSRSLQSIKSLARVRGVSCGKKFAEGFYLNRYIKE